MKKLVVLLEFSSVFNESKWLTEVKINGFSSRQKQANKRFLEGLSQLIYEYNKKVKR